MDRSHPNLSRRAVLRTGCATLAAGLLAACTRTQLGTVTTITLNVAEVVDYGDAIVSFAQTALDLPVVATAMGPASVTLAGTVIAGLQSGLAAFRAAAGTSTSVTYDSTSIKTAFTSILADGEHISTLVIQTITAMPAAAGDTLVTSAKTAAGAAQTLITLLRAMVDASAVHPRMDRAISPDGTVAMAQISMFVATGGTVP